MNTMFLSLLFACVFAGMALGSPVPEIKISLAGYGSSDIKYAVVTVKADTFGLMRASDNKQVFSGALAGPIKDADSGDTCYIADFSDYKEEGEYYIEAHGKGRSLNFNISGDVYSRPFTMAMRSYYHQRCGIAVSDPGGWSHGACHLKKAELHESTGEEGELDVTGGWHDAGDYGKYTVNSGISTGTMILMYERYEGKLRGFNLSIPESGKKLPDVLAEAKWNLDWMMKMQRKDGGVYHKVTTLNFPPMKRAAEDDKDAQYICEVTSTGTANLAAVAAIAARVYSKFDRSYANRCLAAAERAWKYLERNPDIVPEGGFKNPPDVKTGQYGDGDDKDERFWAAAELYAATGKKVYHDYFLKQAAEYGYAVEKPGYWWDVNTLGMLSYAYSGRMDRDTAAVERIKAALINHGDVLIDRTEKNGYRHMMTEEDYLWGSNSIALNYAINLIAASELTGDDKYKKAAAGALYYVFGINPFGMSYVTGIGERRVMNIHHRPSAVDNIEEPWPGLLAGGPNKRKQDKALQELAFDTPPAKCFVDHVDSYASNEIAINWNAPLVYVLAAFMR